MDNFEKAQQIVEQVLPKYFVFRLWETEIGDDGSMTKLYTEKADQIFNDIMKLLENASK